VERHVPRVEGFGFAVAGEATGGGGDRLDKLVGVLLEELGRRQRGEENGGEKRGRRGA